MVGDGLRREGGSSGYTAGFRVLGTGLNSGAFRVVCGSYLRIKVEGFFVYGYRGECVEGVNRSFEGF